MISERQKVDAHATTAMVVRWGDKKIEGYGGFAGVRWIASGWAHGGYLSGCMQVLTVDSGVSRPKLRVAMRRK